LNAAGCIQTNTLNLLINAANFYITDTVIQDISCYGLNDGFAQIQGHGGTPPYTYTLDGGVQTNTSGLFHNLTPGIHTVCASSGALVACDTLFILEPDSLHEDFVGDLVSCHGNDGSLQINISGGTANVQPYLTWWMNAAGDTLNDVFTDNFAITIGDTLTVGDYHVRIEDDHGCFDTAYVHLGQAPPVTVTATAAPIVCFGGSTSIIVNGTGGIGVYGPIPPPLPYPNPSTLTYTINGSAATAGTPFPAGPGIYTVVATDAKLCSATTVLTITAPTSPITNTVNHTSCNTYTWPANGVTYTASGVHTTTLTTPAGCDSVVTLNLTINHSSTGSGSLTACNSLIWNGTTYTTSGVYQLTYTNASGCDSVVTTTLTVNHSNTGTASATSCNSYTWNGTTYSTSCCTCCTCGAVIDRQV